MMARWPQLAGVGIAVAVAVAVGWSLRFEQAILPVFWPGTGVLFGILITTTRADWPRIVASAVVAECLVDFLMAPGGFALRSVLYSFINVFNAYLGARIVLVFLNKPRRRSVAGEILAYSAVAALIAPGVSALPAALIMPYWFETSGYFQTFLLLWSGGFLGISLVAPLVVPKVLARMFQSRPLVKLMWFGKLKNSARTSTAWPSRTLNSLATETSHP